MKWEKGRQQETEYKKLCLYSFKFLGFGFDCYVLKYKGGTILPPHTDPVNNGQHLRLNIGWGDAGFYSEYPPTFKLRIGQFSLVLFRPDINEHGLYVFEKTCKLSFGFAKYF